MVAYHREMGMANAMGMRQAHKVRAVEVRMAE